MQCRPNTLNGDWEQITQMNCMALAMPGEGLISLVNQARGLWRNYHNASSQWALSMDIVMTSCGQWLMTACCQINGPWLSRTGYLWNSSSHIIIVIENLLVV